MTTPKESHTKEYSHVNGTLAELVDRVAVSELCRGWCVYRDASEWTNFRSLFAKDGAYVWTTWSGARTIDDFITISKQGKAAGVFIQHRECGTLVELSRTHPTRAVGKMKATITQRFVTDGIQYDVDCDCKFIFFCEKTPEAAGEWKTRFVKLIYEKDKVVPVDGRTAPIFPQEVLDRFPEGYKNLGAAQSSLGYKVDLSLATAKNHDRWFRMYGCIEKWLDGKDPELFWERDSKL